MPIAAPPIPGPPLTLSLPQCPLLSPLLETLFTQELLEDQQQ